MGTVLWILAVILAIVGVVQILQGQLIFGIILLVLAAAVGPGGWSIFRGRPTV
ncbi:MAG TPA: GPGG-motif small membrane protein [Actinomycetota bacterium]|nr:GPGG-motif small membrane protein [Actinomycetota bacterium]